MKSKDVDAIIRRYNGKPCCAMWSYARTEYKSKIRVATTMFAGNPQRILAYVRALNWTSDFILLASMDHCPCEDLESEVVSDV